MTLEGPAVLALITVFGIGMTIGALMLGAIIIATMVSIKLSTGKLALPVLPIPSTGNDPNEMVAAQKALDAIAGQLAGLITHLKQQQQHQ